MPDLNKDQRKDCLVQISEMSEPEDSDSYWSVPALNLTERETEVQKRKRLFQVTPRKSGQTQAA